MLIVKGVNIFPLQIDQVLMAMPEVGSHYLVALTRENFNNVMRVKVQVQPRFFQEDLKYLINLQKRLTEALKSDFLVTPPGDGAGGAQHPAPDGWQGPEGGG